jgi:DNA-binding transcriptional LysR family regulator
MVLNSQVDIAVTTRLPGTAHLIAERYEHGRLLAFAAPKFLPRGKRAMTLGDFLKVPLVMRNVLRGGRSHDLLKWCERKGVALNIAMRCESPDAVKTAVRAGIGVGILFEDFVKSDVRKGVFKIVRIEGVDMRTSSFIIFHKDRPLSPIGRKIYRRLRQPLRLYAANHPFERRNGLASRSVFA